MINQLKSILGEKYVLTGTDMARWSRDWIGGYSWQPLAVVRPANTAEVSEIVKLANVSGTAIVPVSGNTGLAGGTSAQDALMISLDRMNKIREIRPDARVAIVDAGVILSALHDATDAHNLIFPLTFGARGSAMLGGCLSTNAGGSNVLRYGNTRDLCLGLEVVLPSGEIMDIMSELHKDNSGYNLKHLIIGAEGTLGIITAAVLKLAPKPGAYATAMVAVPSLDAALELLNRLQNATGGAVEAFEYMPRTYIDAHMALFPSARAPFEQSYDTNILVEIGATAARDCTIGESGKTPVADHLEDTLAELYEAGMVLDAIVAQNVAQRSEMWARREAAAEISISKTPIVGNDIAVPLDQVSTFLTRIDARLSDLDKGAQSLSVAHLGDGNIHYTVWPASDESTVHDQIMQAVEEEALALGGSFSAEHGIGLSKKPSMARRKNPVALGVMRAIKTALDPNNIMNPGKVLPD